MNISAWAAWLGALLSLGYALTTAVMGSRTPTRRIFAVGMLALGVESAFTALCLMDSDATTVIRWQMCRLIATSFLIGPWITFSLHYARGDRSRVPRWKQAVFIAISAVPPLIGLCFYDDIIVAVRDSSYAFQSVLSLGWPALFIQLAMLVGSVIVLSNLERTYRAAIGATRWRIKFMLLGLGLLFTIRVYTASHVLVSRTLEPQIDLLNPLGLLGACVLMLRSIRRSGHFETDVYPSPAVLRNSVSLVLVGVYLVLVGLLSMATKQLGGESMLGLNAFLILASLIALAVIAQSDRVKLQLHRFVSRNFQRPFYDYRAAWHTFTETTATKIDQKGLCVTLTAHIAELMRANSVSIWLAREDGDRLTCESSSVLPRNDWDRAAPSAETSRAALAHFKQQPEPVVFENRTEPWAEALRVCHPRQFATGGDRVALPLIAQNEVLGVLLVGDRVAGLTFETQDLDMLRCVAGHAASSLMNIRLYGRVVQSRELEAFQAMAAFFVHDLKNAASTLNLLLPNFPLHWDNPEFRQDAVRGISKTVGRINALIGRLSELRHQLKINAVTTDMSRMVEKVCEDWKTLADFRLELRLGSVPPLPLDPDQIQSVLTNLILNARDAIVQSGRPDGHLLVETGRNESFAVITVKDNGCGISQNFLNNSLFKPFQTTKKNGLGIGMYQSKMIVEAHGGRLNVESVEGEGTVFRILLPLTSTAASSLSHSSKQLDIKTA